MNHPCLRARFIFLLLMSSLSLCFPARAAPDVKLVALVSGLSLPVDIAHAGDASGRLFVVEQGGRIRIIQNGALLATPFLDLTGPSAVVATGGERGLLGLAFHPQYASNGLFFVYFTANPSAGANIATGDIIIARFTRSATNANLADINSRVNLLRIPHSTYGNHNGGALRFGPDGFLYAGVGDGGSGGDPFNSGQDLNSLLGKILRIDINSATYSIPPTNPFASGVGPGNVVARPEVWAYGIRNPWRFSFDRGTGDFYIGDVGQDLWEEIDVQAAASVGGANYGWRILEATKCYNPSVGCVAPLNYVPPLLEYSHSVGNSVTGGYVYRGQSAPDLLGKYLFGDFSQSKLFYTPVTTIGTFAQLTGLTPQVSTFGESEAGELYLANYSTGTISSFSSSIDVTPDAFIFFPLLNVATNVLTTSNKVRLSGLGTTANISVSGGEYSIAPANASVCSTTFTTMPASVASDAVVCVRHTSAANPGTNVTTTLTIGTYVATFTSTTVGLNLLAVESRKQHGNIARVLPIAFPTLANDPVTIEPRMMVTSHTIVFGFDQPISDAGSVTTTAGIATLDRSNNDVVVTLTGISDNPRVTLTLQNVNGGAQSFSASMGFMVGDVSGSRRINASDISAVKARIGQSLSDSNCRFDLNLSGGIDAADLAMVKARSGQTLP